MSIAVTDTVLDRTPVATPALETRIETFEYDNTVVRNFAIATAGWAIVAFLVGLIVALKLVFPAFLSDISFVSYGRLRPLHTNAAIFAFGGNAIFVGVYYSLQRLCKARMFSDRLSAIHFWGWQTIIVLAALTLPLGFTTSKEYAELEWPIDILITGVWIVFGWNMVRDRRACWRCCRPGGPNIPHRWSHRAGPGEWSASLRAPLRRGRIFASHRKHWWFGNLHGRIRAGDNASVDEFRLVDDSITGVLEAQNQPGWTGRIGVGRYPSNRAWDTSAGRD